MSGAAYKVEGNQPLPGQIPAVQAASRLRGSSSPTRPPRSPTPKTAVNFKKVVNFVKAFAYVADSKERLNNSIRPQLQLESTSNLEIRLKKHGAKPPHNQTHHLSNAEYRALLVDQILMFHQASIQGIESHASSYKAKAEALTRSMSELLHQCKDVHIFSDQSGNAMLQGIRQHAETLAKRLEEPKLCQTFIISFTAAMAQVNANTNKRYHEAAKENDFLTLAECPHDFFESMRIEELVEMTTKGSKQNTEMWRNFCQNLATMKTDRQGKYLWFLLKQKLNVVGEIAVFLYGDVKKMYVRSDDLPTIAIAEEMENETRRKKYISHPLSRLRQIWDLYLVIWLLYVAVIVPIRIGFDYNPEYGDVEFSLDIMCDITFFSDMVYNFRTAFYDKQGLLQVQCSSKHLRTILYRGGVVFALGIAFASTCGDAGC